MSQGSVSAVEDWELKSQFRFCLFLFARCIGYFPRKGQWNMTVRNQISSPGQWPWTGVKYRSAQSSPLFSVRQIVSVFLIEIILDLIWVCESEYYRTNSMIPASYYSNNQRLKIYLLVHKERKNKSTDLLSPTSSVKMSHLAWWFFTQIQNIAWALLQDLKLWPVIYL